MILYNSFESANAKFFCHLFQTSLIVLNLSMGILISFLGCAYCENFLVGRLLNHHHPSNPHQLWADFKQCLVNDNSTTLFFLEESLFGLYFCIQFQVGTWFRLINHDDNIWGFFLKISLKNKRTSHTKVLWRCSFSGIHKKMAHLKIQDFVKWKEPSNLWKIINIKYLI